MGGSESRKVSFGLDEREQVRVLQGIRLSEDVVNRMKESPQSKRDNQRSPRSPGGTAPFSPAAAGEPRSPTGIQPPTASDSGQKSSAAEQELYRRYEQEHALVQEELLRLAKREREAASEALNMALQWERNNIKEERQRAAQLIFGDNFPIVPSWKDINRQASVQRDCFLFCNLRKYMDDENLGAALSSTGSWPLSVAVGSGRAHLYNSSGEVLELQGREAELKRQEAFYKEQLARIERKVCVPCTPQSDFLSKNAEIYKLTSQQYQDAATKAEQWIKRRNTDPVCAGLQSEILKCYQENKREVLKCSELAKEYQRCVSTAQKVTKEAMIDSVDALGQWVLNTLEEFLAIERRKDYLDLTTRMWSWENEGELPLGLISHLMVLISDILRVSLTSEQPDPPEIPDSTRTQYQVIVNWRRKLTFVPKRPQLITRLISLEKG
ncbi:Chchd6 [Columba guinea]|nr:Chchd6 [Columba guinea]